MTLTMQDVLEFLTVAPLLVLRKDATIIENTFWIDLVTKTCGCFETEGSETVEVVEEYSRLILEEGLVTRHGLC